MKRRVSMTYATTLLMVIALPAATRAATSTTSRCTGFAAAAPLTANGTMYQSVTTWGEGRAWVGGWSYTADPVAFPVVQRWNGREWQAVAGRPEGLHGGIEQLTAAGPDDVWASGFRYTDDSGSRSAPMLLRVTGGTWTVESLPAEPPLTGIGSLLATSSHDVWVVGTTTTPEGYGRPVLLHRTHAAWQRVALPLPPGTRQASVTSISGTGPDDVWVAGWANRPDPSGPDVPVHRMLLEHWNGRTWTFAPSPDGSLDSATDIAAARRDTGWLLAVKYVDYQEQYTLEHWNGRTWAVIATPPLGSSEHRYLLQLAADHRGNLWLLANANDAAGYRPRVDRWDGRTWTEQPMPPELTSTSGGRAVATSALGHDTWMVADWLGPTWPPQYRSLILRNTCS
ncbi:hypothetical protein ABZ345_26770 [Lentzea sp. NPDC005914]|uniref:hypothetical protein n=1 Tax=Lentzea sp. NPDC005914 TaxID=3154572 RepID=UPI0033CD9671